MTIEQMLQIEPRLKMVIDYAKMENNLAKIHKIYWCDVWQNCKQMMIGMVGWYAEKDELSSSECFYIFHDYLYSITKNTK